MQKECVIVGCMLGHTSTVGCFYLVVQENFLCYVRSLAAEDLVKSMLGVLCRRKVVQLDLV